MLSIKRNLNVDKCKTVWLNLQYKPCNNFLLDELIKGYGVSSKYYKRDYEPYKNEPVLNVHVALKVVACPDVTDHMINWNGKFQHLFFI